jgi:hypothetical protein
MAGFVPKLVAFSEVGGGYADNEDAYAVQEHPSGDCWVCALADGQGGQRGGKSAARRACNETIENALRTRAADLARPGRWIDILRRADVAVKADPEAGYTTLIGFALFARALCGASHGDSAVAAVQREGRWDELTSLQEKNPPIGSGSAAVVPFGIALTAPWTVVAMTDGVWKYTGWDRIAAALKEARGEELVHRLLGQARLPRSGKLQDDFTVVVFQAE